MRHLFTHEQVLQIRKAALVRTGRVDTNVSALL